MSKKIISHFKKADPVFHEVVLKVVEIHGDEFFNLKRHEFLYDRLVESIISQQLSVKVSDVIYQRLINLMPGKKLTPENLLAQEETDLRKVGLSYQKIKYLRDLSEKVKNDELNLEKLDSLENEEVIVELTKVKGIGRWTAEMFLMSALGRSDVFSHGDLGLQNAIKKVYNLKKYNPVEVDKIITKWSPYRTIAARILWRSLDIKE